MSILHQDSIKELENAISVCARTRCRTNKHQWLYRNELDTASSLRRLVDFYVREHNTRLPHSAFQGQTPDEMYLGTGEHVPQDLDSRRKAARAARLAANRSVSCATCEGQRAV